MEILNDCGDAYTKVDVSSVKKQIKEGEDELHSLYVYTWIILIMFFFELAFWAYSHFTGKLKNQEHKQHIYAASGSNEEDPEESLTHDNVSPSVSPSNAAFWNFLFQKIMTSSYLAIFPILDK